MTATGNGPRDSWGRKNFPADGNDSSKACSAGLLAFERKSGVRLSSVPVRWGKPDRPHLWPFRPVAQTD